ncbi:hypothetical protein BDN67DRAFT_873668, partial [Paxillus ammoniavirescens]
MLEFALKHREAVDTVTQHRDLGLRKFKLTDHEWKIVDLNKQILTSIQILKDAALFFSWSMPNLATVIPAMDHINKYLMTYSHDKSYSPAIRAAVSLAKSTLNHYYSLTDSSEVPYDQLTVLHPRHKLAYFKTARWEDEWIVTTEQLMHEEYMQSYA